MLPSPSAEGPGSSQAISFLPHAWWGMKHGTSRTYKPYYFSQAGLPSGVHGRLKPFVSPRNLFPGKLRASLDEVKTDFLSFLG